MESRTRQIAKAKQPAKGCLSNSESNARTMGEAASALRVTAWMRRRSGAPPGVRITKDLALGSESPNSGTNPTPNPAETILSTRS